MPSVQRPDGAVIHYEVFGSGFPLLLFAPGAVNSEIGFWQRSLIDPIAHFQDEFMVIAMDQRHAGESWNAPPTFSYADVAADQLAVLDDAGVERAHVMGGCIGVAYVLGIIHAAPDRITAGVGQDPVGINGTNSLATFHAMFQPTIDLARAEGTAAVIAAAEKDATFIVNNAAGPYARRIIADADFRARLVAMSADEYIALVQAFDDGMWPDAPPLFNVTTDWLQTCDTPLLILPGSDAFHPTSIAHLICETAPDARCLDVDCRGDARIPATIEAVRAFLREHTPA